MTAEHLQWRRTSVAGRRVEYGVAGPEHGLPVLFLHGWTLGRHSYKRALKRVAALGCRVYAPALPDFGGSARLPRTEETLTGYGRWAVGFLQAVGVDEPALVTGHSLGGAVAAALAATAPDRVAHLALVNSIGAGIWQDAPGSVRYLKDRPVWHWAVSFIQDLLLPDGRVPTLRAIAEDCLPNLAANPLGVWRGANLARQADLSGELAAVRAAGVAVTVLWSDGDLVVPRANFAAFCRALGVEGVMVPGGHSWLLADPDAYARVMADVVARVAPAPRLALAAGCG